MLYQQIHLTLPTWISTEIDLERRYEDDAARIALSIRLSALNVEQGSGGPFGAALFDSSGRLLGVGVNRVVAMACSAAHAEMMAYMSAQLRLQSFRLNENGGRVTLATSAQPCAMCYGATFWAGIDELLIAARAEDVTSLTEFDEGPLPSDWIGELEKRGITVKRDLLREQACAVLRQYSSQGGPQY